MKNKFVHLHLHTEYSLLDGVGKIDQYLDRAVELNMKSMAITDHGNMFGAVEFYKKAMKRGINPIIGMEAYLNQGLISDEKQERKSFHLVLLAKNITGYKNLMKLASIGYIDGFYAKPRIDKKILKKYSEGLIGLSACMQGEIATSLRNNRSEEEISEIVDSYIDIFGREDFYIELQDNGIPEQYPLNDRLYEVAQRHELEVVGTNDVHYVYYGQHELQDVLICIQTGSKVADKERMKISTTELFLKTYDQIFEKLGKYKNALENTVKIAERCSLDIKFGELKFPAYPVEEKYTGIDDYLRKLVDDGLEKRYPHGVEEKTRERIEYELGIINQMGYEEYFVVVWDFIDYAKKQDIPIGPGRGSAAGSMVAYALGITELDPIKYGLIFERFLNPERVSMPDIDIDICGERRHEIIDYVVKKYGKDRVAQIITFGTMKARAAIRDVGRVLGVPLSKVDKLAKLIPQFSSLNNAIKNVKEFKLAYETDAESKNLIEISLGLENTVRHSSIHAAGVVITKNLLTEDVPLYSDSKGEQISTQYQMKELEDLGILKMDFLGLRTLTVIKRAIDYINKGESLNIKLEDIPLDGPLVFDALQRGDTLGIFQLESQGVKKLLKKLHPTTFEDIIAVLALYRPGPLGSGMVDDYIDVKNNKKAVKYPHEKLEGVLKETYGVILYQEQVMKIASIMANYSLGEADLLRRAMGKKIAELMEENRVSFIERSVKNGFSKKIAEDVFYLIDKFAGYGFNKSHSAAYGLISYWTIYLKEYFPKYYYAAIMTSESGNNSKIAQYLEDAKKHDVKVGLPNINKVSSKFIVDGDEIRFGMSAIKNLGSGIIEKLQLDVKEFGEYRDFEEFIMRTKKIGLNKKGIEALILSGTLDNLPGNRREKFSSLEKAIVYATRVAKEDDIQQMNLFGEARRTIESFNMGTLEEYKLENLLRGEKEYLGFYFTGHPLDKYKDILDVYELDKIVDLDGENKNHVKTYGMITNIKKIITKKNKDMMAIFTMEDHLGEISCTVFPREYEKMANYIVEGNTIYLEGNTQIDFFGGVEETKIIVKDIKYLEDIVEINSYKVYILIDEETRGKLPELKKMLLKYSGRNKVYIALKEKDNKRVVELGDEYRISISLSFIHEVTDLLGKRRLKVK
ncbi:MAG: DNA polymerase III subunit alpha [Psychrilyobacter sp.]|nr:DNA polymerase III subunit alpha [Psychrilyobacter sp.]